MAAIPAARRAQTRARPSFPAWRALSAARSSASHSVFMDMIILVYNT